MRKVLAISALALLTACNGLASRGPDPVQQQAWANAGTTGSSMECDYMPASCDGWRSGGPPFGWFPSQRNIGGIDGSYAAKRGLKVTPDGETEWEAVYAPTLTSLAQQGVIKEPTYAAFAVAFNKPRAVAAPISRTVQFTSPDGF